MSDDSIEIVPYDPDWPAQFEAERARLASVLSSEPLEAIEHFGSTAIPGLSAKPIIDIMIGVPDVAAARRTFPETLAALDYVFWADNPATDKLFFVKGMPPHGHRRTHHVHVCETSSDQWTRLLFTDYLRAHPEEAAAYEALKLDLARRFRGDREAYTSGKDDFVARILALATR